MQRGEKRKMKFLIQNALEKAKEVKEPEVDMVGQATIKVIGVGGGGGNSISWLYRKGIKGAEVIVCNTDKQHLDICVGDRKILLGKELTRGLGAGGYPQVGEEATKESLQEIRDSLKGADMVFVCCGLGGGTGTGGAHVIARIAKEMGAIVIGTVTMPFDIERARVDKAEFGLQQLRQVCDTVIVIDNNRLKEIAGRLPIQQAFAVANELISTMIKGIVEIIAVPSLVNLDYADVKAIMSQGGVSVIGVGEADSERKVEEATRRALTNPLLDVSYDGATGALIHISGGPDMTLADVTRVGEMVTQTLDPDAVCMWGARVEDDLRGKMRVMTIITGVKSPWVLGKVDYASKQKETQRLHEELGIESVKGFKL